jgi:hypothetical protein
MGMSCAGAGKSFRHLSEEQLVALAQSNESAALAELHRRLADWIDRLLDRRSASARLSGEEATEIRQQGFLVFCKAVCEFTPEDRGGSCCKFRTFLFGMLRGFHQHAVRASRRYRGRTWLIGSARTLERIAHRRHVNGRSHAGLLDNAGSDPALVAQACELWKGLEREIGQLPPSLREVMEAWSAQSSLPQLASQARLSVRTLQVRLHKGLAILRFRLRHWAD